jgi:hypothetical protein
MSTTTEATQQPTRRLIYGTRDEPLDTSAAAMSKRSYTCPACLGPKVGGRALCDRCGSPESLSAWMNGGQG